MAKRGKEYVTTYASGLDRMDSRVLRISTKTTQLLQFRIGMILIERVPSLGCGVISDHIFFSPNLLTSGGAGFWASNLLSDKMVDKVLRDLTFCSDK